MIHMKVAIVVEGKYDKNTLRQLVDAPIFETGGFGILTDKEKLRFLRQVAEKRGLVILTDPDGAGFVIRNYLKGALPKEQVYHAYVPDIMGKEKRKEKPSKEGKLGVEGMDKETIIAALRAAGVSLDGEAPASHGERITHTDLYELGLSGGKDSRATRQKLYAALNLPQHLSTAAFLDAANLLYGREEFFALCEDIL